MLIVILLLVALVLLAFATFNTPSHINLTAAGLAFIVASMLVPLLLV